MLDACLIHNTSSLKAIILIFDLLHTPHPITTQLAVVLFPSPLLFVSKDVGNKSNLCVFVYVLHVPHQCQCPSLPAPPLLLHACVCAWTPGIIRSHNYAPEAPLMGQGQNLRQSGWQGEKVPSSHVLVLSFFFFALTSCACLHHELAQ